ncbi:MAG: sigma-54-dependent Fis family transcriptional regulator [Bdellovibrionales bacterium]|nr:sigma-54-dependent Fis family transcriptional regulator [Bdellovibrionales bacterium]MBT3526080.1 sigma-54-dependent Fis family transcriptional regulator [Bdellovibrionales bacterium]MBT7767326.1 sigma-54-dependent Fis family transcriptional regulator [Bdellovibrionales bacterium]
MQNRLSIERLFQVKGTILITGESGTGKSHLARLIHDNSDRRDAPFIAVNLATLTDDLLASELFGHAKGAFTGAHQHRVGHLESVGAGTLFLDEVGELSLSMQKMLLQLLEDGSYYPVGSCTKRVISGHIIVATNRNLQEMVLRQEFREDLYYRLRIFHYCMIPLREQPQRIAALFNKLKKDFELQYQKRVEVDSKCWEQLCCYRWPGNIRELKHCAEYLVAVTQGDLAHPSDLPEWMGSDGNNSHQVADTFSLISFKDAIAQFEQQLLRQALSRNGGKVNRTAKELEVSKSTLISKIRRYEINIWEMKSIAYQDQFCAVGNDLQQMA